MRVPQYLPEASMGYMSSYQGLQADKAGSYMRATSGWERRNYLDRNTRQGNGSKPRKKVQRTEASHTLVSSKDIRHTTLQHFSELENEHVQVHQK